MWTFTCRSTFLYALNPLYTVRRAGKPCCQVRIITCTCTIVVLESLVSPVLPPDARRYYLPAIAASNNLVSRMFPTSPKIRPHNSIKVIKLQWLEQFRAEFGPKEAEHIFPKKCSVSF